MATNRFTFWYPEWREIDAVEWVTRWAGRYDGGDEVEYADLIEKRGALSADDFEQVGKWKEGCLTPGNGRWKTGTPAAYDVWMETTRELPQCPERAGVSDFLAKWSERKFAAGRDLRKRFGLSRATTLLHFVSGGEYPILDSRVVMAMKRLGSPIDGEDTINGYLTSFCPLFADLAAACGLSGVNELRKLDNALFNYGAERSFRSTAEEVRNL